MKATEAEVDTKPDLQQRLVDALYGPGHRRSESVEELVDAMIAILSSPGGWKAGSRVTATRSVAGEFTEGKSYTLAEDMENGKVTVVADDSGERNGWMSAYFVPSASALSTLQVQTSEAETQEGIGAWADEVFGKVTSLPRTVERAGEELTELAEEAAGDADPDKMIVEAADVVIVLMRFAAVIGRDLNQAVAAKMARNRARKWRSDGTGHGYHTTEAPTPSLPDDA
jgi:NTP pyrophosphatase (non-canonical NTP hydrolase)